MTDPLDKLAHWRELASNAYRGPWYAGTEEEVDYGSVIGYPITSEDGYDRTPILVDDLSIFPGTAEFIAASRTAMPALLTAVENVLKLAERERSAIRATYAPDVPYHQYANAMDDVVTAIRDAIGGAQ